MNADLVVRDVRVADGATLGGVQDVAVVDGRIAARPGADPEVVEGEGRTLVPGLIDAHVHVGTRAHLDTLARSGVTTALDMANWSLSFVHEMRDTTGTTSLRSATISAVHPRGAHARMPGFPAQGLVVEPDEARAFVAARVVDRADYVKAIIDTDPEAGWRPATMTALVDAAHAAGLLVVVHATTTSAFHLALTARVDVVTHAPLDAALDEESVGAMARAGTVSVPTLTMMAATAEAQGHPEQYDHARETVARLHAAGVQILAGTDANVQSGAPAAPPFGVSLHEELHRLRAAGLPLAAVVRAATAAPAAVFGLTDRGRIETGLRADLVMVDGDPFVDAAALDAVSAVWIEGRRVR